MDVRLQPFDVKAHSRSRDATLQLVPPSTKTAAVATVEEKETLHALKLQELYENCQLDDVDLAPEEYIANRLTPSERDTFTRDGYIIIVSPIAND